MSNTFDARAFYLDGIRNYPSGHTIEERNIDLIGQAYTAGLAARDARPPWWPPRKGDRADHPQWGMHEFTGAKNEGGGYDVIKLATGKPSGGLTKYAIEVHGWKLLGPIPVTTVAVPPTCGESCDFKTPGLPTCEKPCTKTPGHLYEPMPNGLCYCGDDASHELPAAEAERIRALGAALVKQASIKEANAAMRSGEAAGVPGSKEDE